VLTRPRSSEIFTHLTLAVFNGSKVLKVPLNDPGLDILSAKDFVFKEKHLSNVTFPKSKMTENSECLLRAGTRKGLYRLETSLWQSRALGCLASTWSSKPRGRCQNSVLCWGILVAKR